MATISAIKVIEAGLASSLSDCAAAGDDFRNTGLEFLRLENTHASATYSIKVKTHRSSLKHPQYGDLTKQDIYKTIASPGSTGATSVYFGPFKPGAFNNANEKLQVFYKTGTGLTAATWNALSVTLASNHKLKIEVLHLDN